MNVSSMTLQQMWLLTAAMTVATFVIYIFLKKHFKLGFKAFLSWRSDTVNKLHDEHGSTRVIMSTFLFGFGAIHILHLIATFIGAILWTIGIWTPVP